MLLFMPLIFPQKHQRYSYRIGKEKNDNSCVHTYPLASDFLSRSSLRNQTQTANKCQKNGE